MKSGFRKAQPDGCARNAIGFNWIFLEKSSLIDVNIFPREDQSARYHAGEMAALNHRVTFPRCMPAQVLVWCSQK